MLQNPFRIQVYLSTLHSKHKSRRITHAHVIHTYAEPMHSPRYIPMLRSAIVTYLYTLMKIDMCHDASMCIHLPRNISIHINLCVDKCAHLSIPIITHHCQSTRTRTYRYIVSLRNIFDTYRLIVEPMARVLHKY